MHFPLRREGKKETSATSCFHSSASIQNFGREKYQDHLALDGASSCCARQKNKPDLEVICPSHQKIQKTSDKQGKQHLTCARHRTDSCLVTLNVIGWNGGAWTWVLRLCHNHFFLLAPFVSSNTPPYGSSTSLHATKTINQSTIQSIHQIINQSINQSINQPFNQSIKLSINQTINHAINWKITWHIHFWSSKFHDLMVQTQQACQNGGDYSHYHPIINTICNMNVQGELVNDRMKTLDDCMNWSIITLHVLKNSLCSGWSGGKSAEHWEKLLGSIPYWSATTQAN